MAKDEAKDNKFCELVAQGMPQTEAYVEAGFSKNYSKKALKVKACEKAARHRDKINAIRAKIKQMAEDDNVWSRTIAINALKLVIDDCKKDGELKEKRAYIAACAELNKMCGHYAPDKHEVRAAGLEDNSIDEVLRNLGYAK